MPPRQAPGRGGHHHHHRGGPGLRGGPGRRAPIPGPFWFPFWGRPMGPGERVCWLCFWMSPPPPPPPVYEEHHHYYDESAPLHQPAPVEPVIVEAMFDHNPSSSNGYREIYAVDYKAGMDIPEKFYVQVPREAKPGEFLECRLGNKQTRVLLPKDIGLGDTIIVISRRS